MTVTLLPNGEQQFVDENGAPYSGGQVYFYVPGTTVPSNTWQDPNGTILNTNPVILDAAGRGIMYGSGDYRQMLFDSSMNLIWDQLTSAPLPDDAISDVMAPVVAASTLQQARDLLGVTSAISAAVSAISLLGGPTGPAGPVGPAGAIGPTGPAGGGGGGGGTNSIQSGSATTDSNGILTVVYAAAFATATIIAVPCTITVPAASPYWFTAYQPLFSYINSAGFQCQMVDTNNNNAPLANTAFNWFSIGY